ncbi:protein ABA AND ROS SENSITIVE 1 isoform X2 [Rhodamnia argentea]|nr:protein ABA AND ROS SENSITIVE 1 isoform X2 [Rhodamnia argentea]
MDAQTRNKTLFRAKLSALKKAKRIDSPLVRYNESDQPVCRVCDIVLKSDCHWDAHQASRKHHEAISNLKASAAGSTGNTNKKSEPAPKLHKHQPEPSKELRGNQNESSRAMPKPKSSSGLPPNFFDNDLQKSKAGNSSRPQIDTSVDMQNNMNGLPSEDVVPTTSGQSSKEVIQTVEKMAGPELKQTKGALPEGFFDSKEADLRARGIKPVKIDVKDEYKEFEKLIQEDLREVDDRLEEEEIDAAEMIETAESVEQKVYTGRVEILRKKKLELKAARSAKRRKSSEEVSKESGQDESSSDDDTEENFAVDWRAQHL